MPQFIYFEGTDLVKWSKATSNNTTALERTYINQAKYHWGQFINYLSTTSLKPWNSSDFMLNFMSDPKIKSGIWQGSYVNNLL